MICAFATTFRKFFMKTDHFFCAKKPNKPVGLLGEKYCSVAEYHGITKPVFFITLVNVRRAIREACSAAAL
jgi:hypothetical protein